MPKYLSSITIDTVIDALGDFLQPFVGQGTEIIRAQENRVSSPIGQFVELTELLQVDLETPIKASDAANTQVNLTSPKRIDIQIDFYGATAGDWCTAVKGVFRSEYAVAQFPDGIKPLYCSDGRQMPLITGEDQYEGRWTLTASLQYDPVVAVPQQSADELGVARIEALG